MNIPITKFYNVADVYVIAAELWLTNTGTIFFYKKISFMKNNVNI